MVGLLSLGSCSGRPKMRNSVIEGLRDRKLDDTNLHPYFWSKTTGLDY